MMQYIPMMILMGFFAAVGIYWAISVEHFLEWTTRSNQLFKKSIGDHQAVLVERSLVRPADGKVDTFIWSIRFLGIVLAFFAIFTVSFIVSSFM
jgi:hypothetical protein